MHRGHVPPPPNFLKRTKVPFFVMKSALFVQVSVAVNTKLTSKVPFLFGNCDVFRNNLVKNVQFRESFFPHPRRQHFRGNFFRCPFQYPKVPLEAGAPNLLMLPTPLLHTVFYLYSLGLIFSCGSGLGLIRIGG